MKKSFETDRLYIRELELCDKDAFYALKSNPIVTEKYLQKPMNKIESDLKLEALIKDIAEDKSYTYAVLDKETMTFLGTIALWNLRPLENIGEIGYEYLPDCWGRGIAAEALAGFIDYISVAYEYSHFDAFPLVNNPASCKVLEKSGFTCTCEKQIDGNTHKVYFRNI